MEENNPIQEMQPQDLKDKIKEWYLLKEKLGKGKTFGDLVQRQENLEYLEEQDVEKFQELQKIIEEYAEKQGIKFDSATGEVKMEPKKEIAETQDNDLEILPQIDETKDTLTKVSGEHAQVTKALYGTGSTNEIPAVKSVVNQTKKDLMQRDLAAKKLLDAKIKLEVAKDRMDMHGAKHVAQKYRLMMQLEQAKLDLIRRVAYGAKENDMSVQILKQEIAGLTNQIADLENQFNVTHSQYISDFTSAKTALEDSQKEVEVERKEASTFNKYSKNLTYSEDGILNGSTIDGVKNGNTIHEQEIYDERGVMIFDVVDVLSREKTINIDGLVVTCVTEFGPGPNVEDSFYIGDVEQLEVNTNAGINSVDEKVDFEEIDDNTEMETSKGLGVLNREMSRVAFYSIGGAMYQANMLSAVPQEQRILAAKGLIALGYDRDTAKMNPESMLTLLCEDIAKKAEEIENDFGERKGPFEETNE